MASSNPSVSDVDDWFDKKMLPRRTAWSGMSPNRVYKSPARLFTGNISDPNGLCADTVSFVFDMLEQDYGRDVTTDGYLMGVAVWDGHVFNHASSVMIPKPSLFKQVFKMQGTVPIPMPSLGDQPSSAQKFISVQRLLTLHVYDLYYKNRTTIDGWWKSLGSKGSITISKEGDFA